jgi:hypothetical protein
LNYFKWGEKVILQFKPFQYILPIEIAKKSYLECVQGHFRSCNHRPCHLSENWQINQNTSNYKNPITT